RLDPGVLPQRAHLSAPRDPKPCAGDFLSSAQAERTPCGRPFREWWRTFLADWRAQTRNLCQADRGYRSEGAATAGGSFVAIPLPRKENPPLPVQDHSQRDFERALLERYSPPAVLVDEHLEILQFRGGIGAFLEP